MHGAAVSLVILVACASPSERVEERGGFHFTEGDIVLQDIPGWFSGLIDRVTQSPYSHMGIVANGRHGLVVVEAIGPVKETDLDAWIRRGKGHAVTVLRLKPELRPKIPDIVGAARGYLGRPYDALMEWDDEKLYCSELIYKAVFNATGVHLAPFVKLRDLNWKPYEREIREVTQGPLPLDREMVTPRDLVTSSYVDVLIDELGTRTAKAPVAALRAR